MADLSQFLSGGKQYRTLSFASGSVDAGVTGTLINETVNAGQVGMLTFTGNDNGTSIISLGGRTVYTGQLAEIDTQYNTYIIGGDGEDITVTRAAAGSATILWLVQIMEEY